MRQRIFQIIEVARGKDNLSRIYDTAMIVVILISLLPLALKQTDGLFKTLENVTTIVFIIDYLLRLVTADLKMGKGKKSFAIYPFTPMAIIDIISILPSIITVNEALRVLRVFRLLRTLRVFRVLKFARYSRSISIITNVFKKQKDLLLAVCGLTVGYIIVSALVIISVEPDTFATFFDAIYWAVVSLTTVGYGDIFAVSAAGKVITMISSIFGVAVVALPAGIITAGYMNELESEKERTEK